MVDGRPLWSASARLTLVLRQTAFPVEMVLQEGNVGFTWVLGGEELFVGGLVDRWSLDILYDSLQGRHRRPVILDVLGEVDLRNLALSLEDDEGQGRVRGQLVDR